MAVPCRPDTLDPASAGIGARMLRPP